MAVAVAAFMFFFWSLFLGIIVFLFGDFECKFCICKTRKYRLAYGMIPHFLFTMIMLFTAVGKVEIFQDINGLKSMQWDNISIVNGCTDVQSSFKNETI